jgi:hypothetical protein
MDISTRGLQGIILFDPGENDSQERQSVERRER